MNNQREQIKRAYQQYAKKYGASPFTDEHLDSLVNNVMSVYGHDERKIHVWLLGQNAIDLDIMNKWNK